MNTQDKLNRLKERYYRLKTIDEIMQSRDRVEEHKRHRTLRILDLKILILMNKMR